MTMTHTPTPAATNFPLAVRELTGTVPKYAIDSPTPSAHGPITVVATCDNPDWAAFLVHAANYHEALRDTVQLLLSKPSDDWRDCKWVSLPDYEPCAEGEGYFLTPLDIAEGKARRILKRMVDNRIHEESATQ